MKMRTLTVGELIDLLNKLPYEYEKVPVMFKDYDSWYYDVHGIFNAKVKNGTLDEEGELVIVIS